MAENTRRTFLRSVLGTAGGLLLPFVGGKALALPRSEAIASIPVTVQALPFSADCLALRGIKREMQALPRGGAGFRPWSQMLDRYGELADGVAARPKPTWADCVELAEIAWHISPKEEIETPGGRWEYTGDLDRGRPGSVSMQRNNRDWIMRVNAALVDAVLTLGGGERFDPQLRR